MTLSIRRIWPAALLLALAACATPAPPPPAPEAAPAPQAAAPAVVAPPAGLRLDNYHALTPETAPGTRVITTAELRQLLAAPNKPVLIDVLRGKHATVPGAVWFEGAGMGTGFDDGIQRRLVAAATRLTRGDKSRTVVVFCLSEMCWLSYNASVRLAQAGFTDVRWYREGNEGWRAAGLPTRPATHSRW